MKANNLLIIIGIAIVAVYFLNQHTAKQNIIDDLNQCKINFDDINETTDCVVDVVSTQIPIGFLVLGVGVIVLGFVINKI